LNRIRSYCRKDWERSLRTGLGGRSLKMVRPAVRLQHALAREDLTGLVESLRKLPKNHRAKLIIMGYARLVMWIDWHAMKLGAPLAIVDPKGASSDCPQCGSKLGRADIED